MKKFLSRVLLVLSVLFALNFGLQSQNFYEGTTHVKVGIGLGGYGLTSATSLPLIALGVDHAFMDGFLDIGNLGLGGVIAVKNYRYDFVSVKYNYNRIFIAPRATLHFDAKKPELDFYAGVQLGIYIWTSSSNLDVDPFSSSFGVAPGIFGGLNYFINDKFALYGELGYGVGFLNVGVVITI